MTLVNRHRESVPNCLVYVATAFDKGHSRFYGNSYRSEPTHESIATIARSSQPQSERSIVVDQILMYPHLGFRSSLAGLNATP